MPRYPSPSEIFHGNQETITDEEKMVLDLIWKTFLKKGESIPEKVLLKKIPALAEPPWEGNPWTRLQSRTPPRLFYAREWHGYRDISPTFIGILYSNRGKRLEKLLVQYLEFIQEVAVNSQPPDRVTGKQVMKAMKLKEPEAFELCHTIVKAGFAPAPREHQNPKSWRLLLPYDIKDILKARDLPNFVVDRAVGITSPPWSPSFQKKFDKLGPTAAQRMQMHGIGDEACMEEPEKADKSEKGIKVVKSHIHKQDSESKESSSGRKVLPEISLQDRKSLRALADDLNAKELARRFDISPRALYDVMDGKAGSRVRRKIAKADSRFTHFADFA
jgi:hypothetical protein